MYPTKKLWEVCEIKTWRKDANYSTEDWLFPFFTCWREILKAPWYSFDTDAILIAWNWDVWACKKYKWKFEAYQRTYVLDNFKDIYKNFLFYFLDWNLRRELLTETLWSAIPYIKLGSLKNQEIPLPPLSTQKLIVEKLDMIFVEIEKSKNLLEKNLQNVDEMNKSVLEKIFANDEWERKKLGEVCELIMWQSPKSETYNTEWVGLPFFQWKKEFWEIFPTPEIFCSNPIKIAEKWDILISVRAPVGPTNIANEKCCIWRWLWAIRAKENCILSSYVFKFFKKFEKEISELWKWSTFASITKTDLENLSIPLPPLETQKNIVSYLDNIFAENQKLKNLYQAQIKNLNEMKQSFLKKAFAGELV